MRPLTPLFEKNRLWSEKIKETDPLFFERLSHQQSPEYLWIGCADSRVPANQIVDLLPGEVFVHRNVANVVVHTDLNCLSVMQYAVDVLHVKHIIICGHYGCGGVQAALNNQKLGLIDNWLRHVQDVHQKHPKIFDKHDQILHWDLLCELNVIEQVVNIAQTTIVQDAWSRKQELAIHGWVYNLKDGLLHDLKTGISEPDEIRDVYHSAISAIQDRFV